MQKNTGKIIAGIIGFLVLGPAGLLFGLVVGHAFDRGLWQAFQAGGPASLRALQEQFFETTFTLLGYVAKADGRVSEAEVAQAEQLFRQLRLDAAQRQRAIAQFKQGTAAEFDPETVIHSFVMRAGHRRQLHSTLVMFLVSMALADGELATPERAALHRIGSALGIAHAEIDRVAAMLTAQSRFQGDRYRSSGGSQSRPPRDAVADAYQALGVAADIGDAELKKVYRKLMSENHPDKLIARGVPDDLVQVATARSQEITAAYELIKNHRGL
jgi:DnaJ like chaperone protein